MKSAIELANMKLPLILANLPGKVEDVITLARKQKDGNRIICNNMVSPVSPFDGKVMKPVDGVESKQIQAKLVAGLTCIGKCDKCEHEMRASAEMAGLLSGDKFHCLVCGEELTAAKVDSNEILAKMHEELGSDDDCDDDDSDDDSDDSEDDDDDSNKEEASVMPGDIINTPQTPAVTPEPTAAPAVETPPVAQANAEITPAVTSAPETIPTPDATLTVSDPKPADAPATIVANTEGEVSVAPVAEAVPPTPEPVLEPQVIAQVEKLVAAGADKATAIKLAQAGIVVAESVVEPTPAPETAPVVETETIDVNLAKLVEWKTATIDIVKASLDTDITYYLFANGNPVAKLVKSKAAKEVQAFFGTEAFVKAFKVAASEGLSTQDNERFGVEPMHTDFTVDKHLIQEQNNKIAALEADVENRVNAKLDGYVQSINTAIVASIKGVWDIANPLREGLVASLKRNGMKDSEHLVDVALAQHAQDFIKAAVVKAHEMADKPENVRTEMAKLVATASYRSGNKVTDKATEYSASLATAGVAVVEMADSNKPQGSGTPNVVIAGMDQNRVKNLHTHLFGSR